MFLYVFIIIAVSFLLILAYAFISAFRDKLLIKLIPSTILILLEALIILTHKGSWGDVAAGFYSIIIIIALYGSLVMCFAIKPIAKHSKSIKTKLCPNCKTEYRKEIEKCSECGSILELVEMSQDGQILIKNSQKK